jgi:transposase
MEKQHVKLRKKDRDYLESLLAKGKLPAKMFKRATALLELDRGKTLQAVAETLGVCYVTVAAWRDNYKERGFKCLEDAPRSGRPVEIDGAQRAKITALACREAPGGHARLRLRLLAEKVVELGYCDRISHVQVDKILKKRTEAASQQDLVDRQDRRSVHFPDGASPMALRAALRSGLPGHLL